MAKNTWNWQRDDWPHFSYDTDALYTLETEYIHSVGLSVSLFDDLDTEKKRSVTLELINSEALETSRIEGEIFNRDSLQNSLNSVFKISEAALPPETPDREVGLVMMMKDLYTNVRSPLTEETLCTWNTMLMKGKLGTAWGKYRSGDVHVVSQKHMNYTITFTGPPAATVAKEMFEFVRWFNKTAPGNKASLPSLTRAALAHLYFVSIHPFDDGNGRISRALVVKSLSQNIGYPTFLSLSATINKRLKDYYTALEMQNRDNHVTPWISYLGRTIIEAQHQTMRVVEFSVMRAKFFDKYLSQLNKRQTMFINRFFKEGPGGWVGDISAKKYMKITKTTSSVMASRDLKRLVEFGIFERTGQRKGTRYTFDLEKAVKDKGPEISSGSAGPW